MAVHGGFDFHVGEVVYQGLVGFDDAAGLEPFLHSKPHVGAHVDAGGIGRGARKGDEVPRSSHGGAS